MDFVPVTYSKEEKRETRRRVFSWLGPGSVAMAQIPVLMATGILTSSSVDWIPLSLLGLMVVGVGMTLRTVFIPDEQEARRVKARAKRIRASISGRYGLNLNSNQFAALSYPKEEPRSNFQAFGSAKVLEQNIGASFIERTVYLVWADGEFQLSESDDGKHFTELQPVRTSLEASAPQIALPTGSSAPALAV